MRQPRTNQLIKAIAKGGGRRWRKRKRMRWFPRIIANTTVNRISNIDQLHSVNLVEQYRYTHQQETINPMDQVDSGAAYVNPYPHVTI